MSYAHPDLPGRRLRHPPFAGNPAAVMPMDRFLEDAVMQAIAAENNLAETAFLVPEGGDYRLRWFTPDHSRCRCAATPRWPAQRWSWSGWSLGAGGWSSTRRAGPDGEPDGCGLRHGLPGPAVRTGLDTARAGRSAGRAPLEVLANAFNYMALLESAQVVRGLAPDMAALARMDRSGVIVTAPGMAPTTSSAATSLRPRASRKTP